MGFIRAYLGALDWLFEPGNKSEAVAILRKNLPAMTEELAQKSYDILVHPTRGFARRADLDVAGIKTVRFDYLNAQEQRKMVWPPSFALARAFVDQLERSKGLTPARITAVRNELAGAEKMSGQARRTALSQLSTQVSADAAGSSDQAKVKMLASAIGDLSKLP